MRSFGKPQKGEVGDGEAVSDSISAGLQISRVSHARSRGERIPRLSLLRVSWEKNTRAGVGRTWKGMCRLQIEIVILILRPCLLDVHTGHPPGFFCVGLHRQHSINRVATFVLSGWAVAGWH